MRGQQNITYIIGRSWHKQRPDLERCGRPWQVRCRGGGRAVLVRSVGILGRSGERGSYADLPAARWPRRRLRNSSVALRGQADPSGCRACARATTNAGLAAGEKYPAPAHLDAYSLTSASICWSASSWVGRTSTTRSHAPGPVEALSREPGTPACSFRTLTAATARAMSGDSTVIS